MTTAIKREALTRISKEAELLSNYAWLAAIATDPQDKKDNLDMIVNLWSYLQRVITEELTEVVA